LKSLLFIFCFDRGNVPYILLFVVTEAIVNSVTSLSSPLDPEPDCDPDPDRDAEEQDPLSLSVSESHVEHELPSQVQSTVVSLDDADDDPEAMVPVVVVIVTFRVDTLGRLN